MNAWTVRIRSIGKVVPDVSTVETFLDGVFYGLRAAGHNVEVCSDTGYTIDVEFSVTTERRAVRIARTIAETLQLEFPRTRFQITLTVDVCRLTGGAA